MTSTSDRGQCRECKKRREVFSCSRKTGGNYRIAQSWRSSSICGECAIHRLTHATPDHGARGWMVPTLRDIVASIDSDEARETLVAYDAKVAEHQASKEAEETRMRPYWDRIGERHEAFTWIRAQQDADGMDEDTCRALAFGIKRGEAGNERTGMSLGPNGTSTWERTMRQQVIDYLTSPEHGHLDAATRTVLADGIRDGLHRPDPKDA